MRAVLGLSLVGVLAASAAAAPYRAPTTSGLEPAKRAFDRLREICAAASPLEPASPPFKKAEAKAFDAAQDRLRAVCADLPSLGGGLEAVKGNLQREDLPHLTTASLLLDENFGAFREHWIALTKGADAPTLPGKTAHHLGRTASAAKALYTALEEGVQTTLARVTRQTPLKPAKPVAVPKLDQ
jgi:hypothetical protein